MQRDFVIQRRRPMGKEKCNRELVWCYDGSFVGAESCELVVAYTLYQIRTICGNNIGLYRDDGLDVFQEPPGAIEQNIKHICQLFTKTRLKITIKANKKISISWMSCLISTLENTTHLWKAVFHSPISYIPVSWQCGLKFWSLDYTSKHRITAGACPNRIIKDSCRGIFSSNVRRGFKKSLPLAKDKLLICITEYSGRWL